MKEYIFAGPAKPLDILINLAIVLLTLLLSIFGYKGWFLDVLAFYTIFFGVGYALTSALFPGRTVLLSQSFTLPRIEKTHEISILERIVISVALSATVIGISGVLLTRVLGLNDITVSFEILTFAVFFTILAAYRRASWLRDPFLLRFSFGTGGKYTRSEKSLMVLVIAASMVFFVVAADSLAKDPQQENFVEVYLSGPDGTVESLPSEMSGIESISMSITSHLPRDQYFTLVISDGLEYSYTSYFAQSDTILLNSDIGRSTSIFVESGENYIIALNLLLLSPGDHTIYFTLISDEETLQLWMPVNVPYSE